MAAMGKRNTSVPERKGKLRYPRCVIYQYQLNDAAYNVLAIINGNNPSASTIGRRKNWRASGKRSNELKKCIYKLERLDI